MNNFYFFTLKKFINKTKNIFKSNNKINLNNSIFYLKLSNIYNIFNNYNILNIYDNIHNIIDINNNKYSFKNTNYNKINILNNNIIFNYIHNDIILNSIILSNNKNIIQFPLEKKLYNYIKLFNINKLSKKLNIINKNKNIISGIKLLELIYENKFRSDNNIIVENSILLNNNLFNLINYKLLESNKLYWINLFNFKNIFETKSSIICSYNIIKKDKFSLYKLTKYIYNNTSTYLSNFESSLLTLYYINNILLESFIYNYLNYNIKINSKHFKLITKNMCSYCIITNSGLTKLIKKDILNIYDINLINYAYMFNNYKIAQYKPIILGITKCIMAKSGFLTNSSFQNVLKILSTSSLNSEIDWLIELKSNLILSKLVPIGTGWLNIYNY